MNYDITFCQNNKCSLHRRCYRWKYYQVYRKDRNKNKKHLISMFIGESGENCAMFWPMKE